MLSFKLVLAVSNCYNFIELGQIVYHDVSHTKAMTLGQMSRSHLKVKVKSILLLSRYAIFTLKIFNLPIFFLFHRVSPCVNYLISSAVAVKEHH